MRLALTAALLAIALPAAAQTPNPAFQFGSLAGLNSGDLLPRDHGLAHNLPVDDPHPILTDRTHGQLRLEGDPELADHDHIQRRTQRQGHLQRHRDPAAWQAKHHQRLPAQMLQFRGQPPARIGTISEHCQSPLLD